MSIQDLIPEAEYVAQRRVTLRTVQRERAQHIGPPFIKLGRAIFYRPAAIDAWLLAVEQNQPRTRKSA